MAVHEISSEEGWLEITFSQQEGERVSLGELIKTFRNCASFFDSKMSTKLDSLCLSQSMMVRLSECVEPVSQHFHGHINVV